MPASETCVDYQSQSFNKAPNGTSVNFSVGQQCSPGSTVTVPAAANFSTTSPLIIGSTIVGTILYIFNLQATAIKVVGPTAGDPGILIDANSVTTVTFDPNQFIAVPNTGAGGAILPPLPSPGDDGANITAALAAQGVVTLKNGATYNIATPITFASTQGQQELYLNGATLKGAMANSGNPSNPNSVIYAAASFTGVGNTVVTSAPQIGDKSIAVAVSPGGAPFIEIANSLSGQVLNTYKCTGIVGLTMNLDRPIDMIFDAAATVKPINTPPHPKVYGPGIISGTGDAAIYFRECQEPLVDAGIRVNTSLGNLARGVIFEGCYDGEVRQLSVFNPNFDLGLAFLSCSNSSIDGSSTRGPTVAGIFVRDGSSVQIDNSEAAESLTAGAAGIAFSGTSAASSSSIDCTVRSCVVTDNDIGLGVAFANDCVFDDITLINSATKALDVGPGATTPTDCIFSKIKHLGGACASGGIVVSATAVRPSFRDVLVQGQTGAADVFSCAAGAFTLDGFTALSSNTTTGVVLHTTGAASVVSIRSVNITMKTAGAATFGVQIANTAGYITLQRCNVGMGVANDVGINQSGICIAKIEDIFVTNPGGGGGTSGFLANGATSATWIAGYVDCSAAATPLTFVQASNGTIVANNNVAVDYTFKAIHTGARVFLDIRTPAGTPAFAHTKTVTDATKVTVTFTNLDTSTYDLMIASAGA